MAAVQRSAVFSQLDKSERRIRIVESIQKVKLGVPRIGFIGHFLDKDGLHCDPAKHYRALRITMT